MSTLNSYFNTRKARSVTSSKSKKSHESTFAAQAPQPVQDIFAKNTPTTTTTTVRGNKDKRLNNSILYYLSPVKKELEQEVKEEEEHILCRIRMNIPVSNVWNHILQGFNDYDICNNHTRSLSLKRKIVQKDTIRNVRLCQSKTSARTTNRNDSTALLITEYYTTSDEKTTLATIRKKLNIEILLDDIVSLYW